MKEMRVRKKADGTYEAELTYRDGKLIFKNVVVTPYPEDLSSDEDIELTLSVHKGGE